MHCPPPPALRSLVRHTPPFFRLAQTEQAGGAGRGVPVCLYWSAPVRTHGAAVRSPSLRGEAPVKPYCGRRTGVAMGSGSLCIKMTTCS